MGSGGSYPEALAQGAVSPGKALPSYHFPDGDHSAARSEIARSLARSQDGKNFSFLH